jgi:hypothetical protein
MSQGKLFMSPYFILLLQFNIFKNTSTDKGEHHSNGVRTLLVKSQTIPLSSENLKGESVVPGDITKELDFDGKLFYF